MNFSFYFLFRVLNDEQILVNILLFYVFQFLCAAACLFLMRSRFLKNLQLDFSCKLLLLGLERCKTHINFIVVVCWWFEVGYIKDSFCSKLGINPHSSNA